MSILPKNEALFQRAKEHICGGVNSPVRAFSSVGGTPRFIVRGQGSRMQDVEKKTYTDYVGSWGAAIAGHAHPKIVAAVQQAAIKGLSFGAPTEAEIEFADMLCDFIPSMQMLRLVSSGTEATMSAIRLARGYTQRDLLIKFEGCYHGHSDSLLVKAGSGALTFSNPSSDGVPEDIAKHTLVLPYNDTASLQAAFKEHGDKIAAVIVEPIAGNMNLILPHEDFLQSMRALTQSHGALLIFDEVMTGFRVALNSAQGLYQIEPDLSTFGKVIGGGMPLGAFGGRQEIMSQLSPLGGVYQAGTLSGNPIAVAAGMAQLQIVSSPGFYKELDNKTETLCTGMLEAARANGYNDFSTQSIGGMFGLYFTKQCPSSYDEVVTCNQDHFKKFFHAMLEAGHYFAPSAFEAGFVSSAHTHEDIQETIDAAHHCFAQLNAT